MLASFVSCFVFRQGLCLHSVSASGPSPTVPQGCMCMGCMSTNRFRACKGNLQTLQTQQHACRRSTGTCLICKHPHCRRKHLQMVCAHSACTCCTSAAQTPSLAAQHKRSPLVASTSKSHAQNVAFSTIFFLCISNHLNCDAPHYALKRCLCNCLCAQAAPPMASGESLLSCCNSWLWRWCCRCIL